MTLNIPKRFLKILKRLKKFLWTADIMVNVTILRRISLTYLRYI
nr:MAG TPA: hypothetical protein [Caudoviricetes sp.]